MLEQDSEFKKLTMKEKDEENEEGIKNDGTSPPPP